MCPNVYITTILSIDMIGSVRTYTVPKGSGISSMIQYDIRNHKVPKDMEALRDVIMCQNRLLNNTI